MFQQTNQRLIQQVLYNIRMEGHRADEILKYKELLYQRIITEEEF